MLNDVIKKKEKKSRKIKKIHGDDKWLRGKWGEVSPTLVNSCGRKSKGIRNDEKREKEREEKKEREKKN